MTPNELVLTFGGLHLCVKFGENRQRNATVRVMTHGQTDRQTDRQTHSHTDRRKPILLSGADNYYCSHTSQRDILWHKALCILLGSYHVLLLPKLAALPQNVYTVL